MAGPLIPRNEADPTGQDKRERGAINDFAKRMREVKLGVKAILDRQNYQIITLNAAEIQMRKYDFNVDETVMSNINEDIQRIIDAALLQGGQNSLWLLTGYVLPAYQQGTGQAYTNLSVQSADYAAARPSLESVLLSDPYRRRLGYVKARLFEDMQGLTSFTKERLGRVITQGMADGKNPREIAKAIDEQTIICESRARLIARTEVNTALRRARLDEDDEAAASLGIRTMQLHISALSPTTRPEHARRNGNLYTTDQQRAFWSTNGNSCNCYLPGTRVAGRFVAGSEAWYEGPVFEVVTRGGRNFTVTPNHPVMTARGLIPAAELLEGDDLFAYSGQVDGPGRVGKLDSDLVNPTIEEVFGSLVNLGHSDFRGVQGVEFHGDGSLMDKGVNIVRVDDPLAVNCQPGLAQALDKFGLIKTDAMNALPISSGNPSLQGINGASARDLGRKSIGRTLLGICLAMANKSRFRSASVAQSGRIEPAVKRNSGDSCLLGYLQDRLAGSVLGMKLMHVKSSVLGNAWSLVSSRFEALVERVPGHAETGGNTINLFAAGVATDSILNINVRQFAGHVYDLEEVSGMMLANDLFLSNCKCSTIAVLVDNNNRPLTPSIIQKVKNKFPGKVQIKS